MAVDIIKFRFCHIVNINVTKPKVMNINEYEVFISDKDRIIP